MKRSYTWKVVLIIVIIALAILGLESKPIRRGIDLRGGAELLFKIDTSGLTKQQQLLGLTDKTVDIIRERIDPTGEKGIIIQTRDQHRIMMQLPGFSRDQTKEIIALATNMGKLQWRLVAKDDPTKIALLKAGKKIPGYKYYKYAKGVRQLMLDTAAKQGRSVSIPEGLLVRVDDKYNITGELLSRVQATVDRTGGPAVLFEMKPEGARRLGKLTGDHQGERLAIILNDQLYSAPTIQDRISDRGVITNIPTAKERDNLVKVLNSGSLKAPLILESEQYVGPMLGARTIKRGIKSGIIAGIAVLTFMLIYYFVAGAIADFALCLNILVLLAVMAVSRATLTLPGIAGIVLTVGMAVDANVLIFERIREELRLKRDLPVAIRMGYEKAFSAIFDSNLTTFATAAILYVFGTGPVRGFAITLSIGILVSFFTAVFVTRVIFELLVKHGLIKQVKMLHILTRTNVPFMKYARIALLVSLMLITAGLWVFASRGKENLDIDFTGGSVAHLNLTKEMHIDEVRSRMAKAGFPQAKIQAFSESVTNIEGGQNIKGASNVGLLEKSKRFALRVNLKKGSDLASFEEAVAGAFADVVEKRVIDLSIRRASKIIAKNDKFFGGVRCDAQLAEALPPRRIAAQIAALGLPKYELEFLRADENTGALKKAPENAPAISIFRLTVADITPEALRQKLAGAFAVPNPFPEQISQIGSQVASQMATDALLAILLAMGFIIIYIWLRFGRIRYGFAAVVALIHDVLFTVGALAVGDYLGGTAIGQALLLGDFKINLAVIAALLTIVGYSLNDTIVVFDRIRENMRLKTKSDWEIVTGSINQTLSRTFLTSLTTLLVVVIMYVFGGPGIHSFAYVMIVGVLAGTYSSIFIASPMLLLKDVLRGKPIAQGDK